MRNRTYRICSMMLFLSYIAVVAVLADNPSLVLKLNISRDSSQFADTLSVADSTQLDESVDIPLDFFEDKSNVQDLSLEECIQLAVKHNRILRVFRLSQNSAKIHLKMAESRFLPSANISGGRNESRNDDLGYVITKTGLS